MKLSLWHDDLAVWGAAAVTIHTDTCTHALYGVCVCVDGAAISGETSNLLKKKGGFFSYFSCEEMLKPISLLWPVTTTRWCCETVYVDVVVAAAVGPVAAVRGS